MAGQIEWMTLFEQLALVEHQHPVADLGGMEPVGHRHQGAGHAFDGFHDLALAALIEGAGGFIH